MYYMSPIHKKDEWPNVLYDDVQKGSKHVIEYYIVVIRAIVVTEHNDKGKTGSIIQVTAHNLLNSKKNVLNEVMTLEFACLISVVWTSTSFCLSLDSVTSVMA